MSAGDLTKFQASMSKTKGNPKDAETLQSYLVEKVAGSNRKKEGMCLFVVPLDVLYNSNYNVWNIDIIHFWRWTLKAATNTYCSIGCFRHPAEPHLLKATGSCISAASKAAFAKRNNGWPNAPQWRSGWWSEESSAQLGCWTPWKGQVTGSQ